MSIPQGRAEWERIVADLERRTQSSLTTPNPPFDLQGYQYAPVVPSENVASFLQQEKNKFQTELYGDDPCRAVLPLYVPRVSMVEAVHVMPPEPRATDAFNFVLPERVEDLKSGGPDWLTLANNAIAACNRRIEQQKRAAENNNNSAAGGQQQQQQRQQQGQAAADLQMHLPMQLSARLIKLSDPGLRADFMPIIIVSGGAMAPVQMANVQKFLELGIYEDPSSAWTDRSSGQPHLAERDTVGKITVSPARMMSREPSVKFRQFEVLADVTQVKNWNHVCACFVTGSEWEVEEWYGAGGNRGRPKIEPRTIFDVELKAFLPFFEDEKEPAALKKWRVVPLQLSRRQSKAHVALRMSRLFWESLYAFLETSSKFRNYTLEGTSGLKKN